jgi:hypothetical protein
MFGLPSSRRVLVMRRKGDDVRDDAAADAYVGWREDAGFLLFTSRRRRAMQRWIDRSIAHRPMPTPYSGPQLSVGDGASVS